MTWRAEHRGAGAPRAVTSLQNPTVKYIRSLEMRKVRRTMQPPFRRLRKPEMLHSIGDVRVRRVDACLGKGLVQQSAGRSDERLTLPVLLVSWLLTNEDNAREW